MNKIYTIGYQGVDIDLFIQVLSKAGIELVADVRARPFSRKKGFSKSVLQNVLSANCISYQHFAGLGDPKAGRDAAKAGYQEQFRQIYEEHFQTASAKSQFSELICRARNKITCLVCFERNPIECHRSIIAESMTLENFESVNLFADGTKIGYGSFTTGPRRDPGQGLATTEQNIR